MSDEQTTIIKAEPTVMGLFQQAMDRGMSPDELDKWMALRRTWNEEQAVIAFQTAMNAVQSELPPVIRDKTNKGTDSRYATLEAVNNTVTPIITKHGFSVSYNEEYPNKSDGTPVDFVWFCATLMHKGGHSKEFRHKLPLDDVNKAKNRIQSKGSTVSYGRRYLKLMMFDITIQDEDTDGNIGPDTISDDAVATLNEMLAKCREVGNPVEGKMLVSFLKSLGVDEGGTIADIQSSKFLQAVARLSKRLATRTTEEVKS